MAALIFSTTIADKYKEVSEVINSVNPQDNTSVRRKTMKQIMTESFFHGANKFGDNFIA